MKALIAAASAAAMAALAPALAHAQDARSAPTGLYGNLGYSNANAEDLNFGVLGGRLGYRFNNWLGVEGELGFGVKGEDVSIPSAAVVPGGPTSVEVKVEHTEAIYAVGFIPLGQNFDLLARIGYGNTSLKGSAGGVSASEDGDSWNFGVGGQYHFDGVNGVRVDYTRQEFRGDDAGHSDVWSIAYSRRF
jgi:outer membrane immunogenic protein